MPRSILYQKHLASPEWGEFRKRYAEERSTKCLICGKPKSQLHHITYERLGREELDDVIPLCRLHHGKVHVWIERKGLTVHASMDAVESLKRCDDVTEREVQQFREGEKRNGKKNKKRKQRRDGKSIADPVFRREVGSTLGQAFFLRRQIPMGHPILKDTAWMKNAPIKVKIAGAKRFISAAQVVLQSLRASSR